MHVGDDHELVTADARSGVARPHVGRQSSGDVDEDRVAGCVAMGVVVAFRAVDVDEDHGHSVVVSRAFRQRLLQSIHDEPAVGQPCQRVVGGSVGQLPLGGKPGRDVLQGGHPTRVPLTLGERHNADLQPMVSRGLGRANVALAARRCACAWAIVAVTVARWSAWIRSSQPAPRRESKSVPSETSAASLANTRKSLASPLSTPTGRASASDVKRDCSAASSTAPG
jgi:hypothetical protein